MSSIKYKERVRQALQAMPEMTADEFYSQMSRSMGTPLKYIKMTNEQINIAIAEACGWDFDPIECAEWGSRQRWCKSPHGKIVFRHGIPDYCSDLNAMHEAEKVLSKLEQDQYWDHLKDMTCEGFDQLHSNSRQRAEAFLKTINKWKE